MQWKDSWEIKKSGGKTWTTAHFMPHCIAYSAFIQIKKTGECIFKTTYTVFAMLHMVMLRKKPEVSNYTVLTIKVKLMS